MAKKNGFLNKQKIVIICCYQFRSGFGPLKNMYLQICGWEGKRKGNFT